MNRVKKAKKIIGLSLISLVPSIFGITPALAHHSFAMFDQTREVTISGTIVDIQWTNPHVWMEVDVPQDDGSMARWSIEFTSRVHLTRRGFPKDDIQVGDEATFKLNPYVNGDNGGRFSSLETGSGIIYPLPRT